jgi:hypothetical protein
MNKAQALKLVEVTSQRQADNGSVCYHDPITNCDYISYASGYVRRKYSARNWRGNIVNTVYQLNKTRQVPVSGIDYYGNHFTSTKTERILEMDPEARLEIICRAAVNYRKTVKKYANA